MVGASGQVSCLLLVFERTCGQFIHLCIEHLHVPGALLGNEDTW